MFYWYYDVWENDRAYWEQISLSLSLSLSLSHTHTHARARDINSSFWLSRNHTTTAQYLCLANMTIKWISWKKRGHLFWKLSFRGLNDRAYNANLSAMLLKTQWCVSSINGEIILAWSHQDNKGTNVDQDSVSVSNLSHTMVSILKSVQNIVFYLYFVLVVDWFLFMLSYLWV